MKRIGDTFQGFYRKEDTGDFQRTDNAVTMFMPEAVHIGIVIADSSRLAPDSSGTRLVFSQFTFQYN